MALVIDFARQRSRSAQPTAPLILLGATILGVAATASAQVVTLPPSGGNQKAAVIQDIGLVEVRIDYSSPDVHGPNGEDRTGKIWGQLVPWGLADLGFGNGKPSPWRAGANENTVFTVSHDVTVQDQPLPAGRYGLHMIPGEQEWTIVFSKNSSSWGSFFYDESEDALRVTTRPEKAEYREWLAYDFIDRDPDQATVALHWENLRVPFTIKVPNLVDLYVANLRNELRSTAGFSWQGFDQAAQYCLANCRDRKEYLEQALQWIETASTPPLGEANFTTLSTRAQVLHALGRDAESMETLKTAVMLPAATAQQIHSAARQLQIQGLTPQAIQLFKLNAERFGADNWPLTVGLARAYSAEGDYKRALEYAKKARAQAPDPLNQGNLDTIIELLEGGKDFNVTN
jgi:tetratricopeptide (TPR) repeat protein